MDNIFPSFSYAEEKFVNRDAETSLVIQKLTLLLSGSPPDRRTIAFMGERGIGKSWLLQHLYTTIKAEEKFKSVTLCPIDLAEYNNFDPVLAVLDTLKKFKSCLPYNNEEPGGATPAESSRRTLEEVREYLKKHFLTLFVDHVYESDWKLLAGLEDYLLGPLAIEPNTLIVLSGRGREYPWKTPELRLKAEFKNLQPLSEKDTEEQLRIQISPEAAQRTTAIVTATGGNPLGNYLLGKESDPKEGFDAIIKATLDVIADQERRQRIRNYLEALCVLRAFDEERIPAMFAAYFDDEQYNKWGYAQTRQVRDDLVQSSFARWNEQQGGFMIDEMLRKSLENYMQSVKPEVWLRLQETALTLYKVWGKKFSRSRNFWLQEANYHNNALLHHGAMHTRP